MAEGDVELPTLTADARALRALELLAEGHKVMWPVYVRHLEAATSRATWQRALFESALQLLRAPLVELDLGRAALRLTLGSLAIGGLIVIGLLALAKYLAVDEQIAALWSLGVCLGQSQ